MTKTTNAPTFKINGETQDLKLNFEGIKFLNTIYEGGSYEVIGKALMGDLDIFPYIVDAALRHTGNEYTIDDVEQAMDEAINSEELSLKDILRLSNELVSKHSFYKETVNKLLKSDDNARTMLESLLDD